MKRNKSWAVLFDLDETLVLTNPLEALRRARRWNEVYAAFAEGTRLPQGTVRFLQTLSDSVVLGVVTKAPRSYAEKLLAHHGIDIPVAVAYHDVKKVKPDPEALLLASKRLGIAPNRCIYVGDDANDVQAAQAAGFIPIGICWGEPVDIGLTSVCTDWAQVYDKIQKLISG